MTRSYELWDVAIGKRLARSEDRAEMASIIHTLVRRHASAMLDDLELYTEDESGETVKTSTGRDVLKWADGVSTRATAAAATA